MLDELLTGRLRRAFAGAVRVDGLGPQVKRATVPVRMQDGHEEGKILVRYSGARSGS